MPELPEVETTVNILKQKIIGEIIEDVWIDTPRLVKKPSKFPDFKKKLIGRSIKDIQRKGKNILIFLDNDSILLFHQKLTGHLLFGKWKFEGGIWRPLIEGPLEDPMNKFIHFMVIYKSDWMLALSDLRKFAKIEFWKDKEELFSSSAIKDLGPDPLDPKLTFQTFKERLLKKKGVIKKILMDQTVIAGIGNIYSDEILWRAKVHPLRDIRDLREEELKAIYKEMKKVLKLAIDLHGESISDYRTPEGKKGFFDKERRVYRREGEKCFRCGGVIKRIKIGGRSAHFCPKCQR
jgi:formamidopyrimidine-DNA glycosylase